MSEKISTIKICVVSAIGVSLKSALWLLKFMIPITLIVSILNYLGVVAYVSQFVEPLFSYAGLDGRGVFVFITSIFASIYSAIAVMAALGIDFRMAVILSSMILIAHNLIVESTIQKKTGSSFFGMITLRIVAAFVTGVVINLILPASFSGTLILNMASAAPTSWSMMFTDWLKSMGTLTLQVLMFVTALNIIQNILREFKILDMLTKPLQPLMTILGLPYSTTFLWLVANTLGLAYGGAVMISEVEKGEISSSDTKLFNVSIACTHSLIEDTLLLFSIGIPLFWIFLPRILCSIVVVWGERGVRYLTRKKVLA